MPMSVPELPRNAASPTPHVAHLLGREGNHDLVAADEHLYHSDSSLMAAATNHTSAEALASYVTDSPERLLMAVGSSDGTILGGPS